jgi:hypothetical protein
VIVQKTFFVPIPTTPPHTLDQGFSICGARAPLRALLVLGGGAVVCMRGIFTYFERIGAQCKICILAGTLLGWNILLISYHWQGDHPVNCNRPIWHQSCTAAVDVTWLPGQNIGVDSQQFLWNTQLYFQLLHHELVSFTKALFDMTFAVGQLVARWSTMRTTRVWFRLMLYFS